ncbi:MAG: hypothetical protein ACRD2L_19435, partial [Terriglobia bacterium]
LVTNRGHEKRLRRQLEHGREQKRLEREMSLRKAVYLEAAEAVTSSLAAFGRLADLSVPQDDLAKQFSEMTRALAKVQIIGSSATLSAVSIFSTEATSAVLELTLARQPLLGKQGQLTMMDDQIKSSGEERDRMVQLMKQLNFEGDRDTNRWQFLKDTFEYEQKRVGETLAEQAKVRSEFWKEWLDYAQRCYETSTGISQLLVPAMRSVREELGLPFDAEAYRKRVEASQQRQNQAMSEFFRRVQGLQG